MAASPEVWLEAALSRAMSKPKIGATVRLRVQSGEMVEGKVVYLWKEKSVEMVRVASGNLVYNIPARLLVDKGESK